MKSRFALIGALLAACLLIAGTVSAQVIRIDSTDVPKRIPAAGTSGAMETSTITVADGICDDAGRNGSIADVEVEIDYDHTFNGDLDVRLTGPGGQSITLWTAVGGSLDDMFVTIDDEAASNITGRVLDGSARRPEGFPARGNRMCELTFQDGGDWGLDITDNLGGDSGMLNGWALIITCADVGRKDQLPCGETPERERKGRGLGSWANNGRGNGDDLPPPGQR